MTDVFFYIELLLIQEKNALIRARRRWFVLTPRVLRLETWPEVVTALHYYGLIDANQVLTPRGKRVRRALLEIGDRT